ncbi:hypothetical protein [Acetivibrio clariflavus]|uniref:Uncharacterized protein n=1 Tax=Acetivibrio clariflavus (strain DSM 19732 / NBRC 101661 / EBR45) TaxID=720554 RepID=G8M110_ACECE|nr:hypothetical protein [Acetivibrio clariflavus]AEV66951.1 hypothetical protein Clocl_0207 [Acetivibrio clariflavus DSM 19732]
MLLKPEEIYTKFNEENIQVIIPKKLLFTLLQQVDRLREILGNEEEIVNNFAIYEYIGNAEMLMVKLYILIAEPYNKKEVIIETSIAEFLVLRDLVFCNYSLPHLREELRPSIRKTYKDFYDYIQGIFEMLEVDEVKAYWDFIKNYQIEGGMLQ